MLFEEKPKITLKFEVNFPDLEGGPSRKFSVNKTLKARWSEDSNAVTLDILNEIKNYKGSFVGDMLASLKTIVKNERAVEDIEQHRKIEVSSWAACLIEKIIFHAIKEKIHENYLDNELEEWDGTFKEIEPVSTREISEVDIDKLMILLAPKLKHMLMIIAKNTKK